MLKCRFPDPTEKVSNFMYLGCTFSFKKIFFLVNIYSRRLQMIYWAIFIPQLINVHMLGESLKRFCNLFTELKN
jgi:hypothetical protein